MEEKKKGVAAPIEYVEGKGLAQVVSELKAVDLPTKESTLGDLMIAPSFRRKMKGALLNGFVNDLVKMVGEDGEVVKNSDGLMIVAENDDQGFYTIQVDFKIKNLDYDPFD